MAGNQAAPADMNVNSVCDLAHHRHDGNGHSKDGRVRGTIVMAEGDSREAASLGAARWLHVWLQANRDWGRTPWNNVSTRWWHHKGWRSEDLHATVCLSDVYIFLLTCYFEHDVCHHWGCLRKVCSWFYHYYLKFSRLKILNNHVSANDISLFSNWDDLSHKTVFNLFFVWWARSPASGQFCALIY